jgi:hypothetical protein
MFNRSLLKTISTINAVTVDVTNDMIFLTAHGHNIGDIIYFDVAAGTLPTAAPVITEGKAYFISYVESDSLKVSEQPGGTSINFTNAGTAVRIRFQKQGYVQTFALNSSGLADTITGVWSANLDATDSLYFVHRLRKTYDYQEFIYTGYAEIVTDATNQQGRRILDTKQAMYLFSVNSAVETLGTSVTFNIYNGSGATAMFTSAPVIQTTSTLNAQRPDAAKQYVAQGSNIKLRITAVSGTNVYFQTQIYLIPCLIYAAN